MIDEILDCKIWDCVLSGDILEHEVLDFAVTNRMLVGDILRVEVLDCTMTKIAYHVVVY